MRRQRLGLRLRGQTADGRTRCGVAGATLALVLASLLPLTLLGRGRTLAAAPVASGRALRSTAEVRAGELLRGRRVLGTGPRTVVVGPGELLGGTGTLPVARRARRAGVLTGGIVLLVTARRVHRGTRLRGRRLLVAPAGALRALLLTAAGKLATRGTGRRQLLSAVAARPGGVPTGVAAPSTVLCTGRLRSRRTATAAVGTERIRGSAALAGEVLLCGVLTHAALLRAALERGAVPRGKRRTRSRSRTDLAALPTGTTGAGRRTAAEPRTAACRTGTAGQTASAATGTRRHLRVAVLSLRRRAWPGASCRPGRHRRGA